MSGLRHFPLLLLLCALGFGCRGQVSQGASPQAPAPAAPLTSGAMTVAQAGPTQTPRVALLQDRAWERFEVRLSEICPVPAAGEPTWVELYNRGSSPASVAGWSIRDKAGKGFVIPGGFPLVPAGAFVVIVLSGPGASGQDDLGFDGDNAATVHATDATGVGAFGGVTNDCALFASGGQGAEQMVDYVAWGTEATSENATLAASVGLWKQPGSPLRTVVNVAPGSPRGLEAGDSIARILYSDPRIDAGTDRIRRVPRQDWAIWPAEYVTQGETNTPPGPTGYLAPAGGVTWPDGVPSFSFMSPAAIAFLPDREEWTAHIQVQRTPDWRADFRDLVIDARGVRAPYRHTSPLPAGNYSWRVRKEKGDQASAWSPTIQFQVIP